MITNVRLDISDDKLQMLASRIAGKPVRRPAKRKEIVSFVEGCIAAACEGHGYANDGLPGDAIPGASNLTSRERSIVERLRSEGKDDGYIIGWLIGGRPSGAERPRLSARESRMTQSRR